MLNVFFTAERSEQLERLGKLQNNGYNDHQDIMSITGAMKTAAEVEAHIAWFVERAAIKDSK